VLKLVWGELAMAAGVPLALAAVAAAQHVVEPKRMQPLLNMPANSTVLPNWVAAAAAAASTSQPPG
jgi:hypothetical protein